MLGSWTCPSADIQKKGTVTEDTLSIGHNQVSSWQPCNLKTGTATVVPKCHIQFLKWDDGQCQQSGNPKQDPTIIRRMLAQRWVNRNGKNLVVINFVTYSFGGTLRMIRMLECFIKHNL